MRGHRRELVAGIDRLLCTSSEEDKVMDSGSWAEWASALLTGAGLAAAVYQLAAGRRDGQRAERRRIDEEQERRLAMARAVGVKVHWSRPDPVDKQQARAEFEVLNSSPYPISGVRVDLECDVPGNYQLVVGTILPGERVADRKTVPRTELAFSQLTYGVKVHFTDVYGNHWTRTPEYVAPQESAARIC